MEGEHVHIHFPEEQVKRARNTIPGIYEHYYEIQNMIKVCVPKLVANKEKLEKEMEIYKRPFDEVIKEM